MEKCDICEATPPGVIGIIPEVFADVMAVSMIAARGHEVNLCAGHYGRMFWSGTAYAERVVFNG